MSESNSTAVAEDPSPSTESTAAERVDELTDAWETSPLTDPAGAQDPAAKPIGDHGDTPVEDERIAQRPDF